MRGDYIVKKDVVLSSLSSSTVTVNSGKLQGFIDNGTYVYRGIPYAKAKRFMMPEPVEPWDGLWGSMSHISHEKCFQC